MTHIHPEPDPLDWLAGLGQGDNLADLFEDGPGAPEPSPSPAAAEPPAPDSAEKFRQMALRTLNGQLEQQRANARALHPSAPPPQTLGDAISLVTLPGARPGPTAKDYRAWVAKPDLLTDELHAEHCSGGVLVLDTLDTRPCPRCQQEARAATLRAQLEASGVVGRYLDVEWADLRLLAPLDRVARASAKIGQIIATGANLVLYSEQTGDGKTQAAMLCAKAAVRAGFTAHVGNLARLAVDVRDGIKNTEGKVLTEKGALARLTAPDLLVIDDLSAGETEKGAIERRLLFLALDERQTRRRPTIITTNLFPEELAQTFGRRVLARLQPLTLIHVDHGVNFRLEGEREELW